MSLAHTRLHCGSLGHLFGNGDDTAVDTHRECGQPGQLRTHTSNTCSRTHSVDAHAYPSAERLKNVWRVVPLMHSIRNSGHATACRIDRHESNTRTVR
jgi:hypothetical protein